VVTSYYHYKKHCFLNDDIIKMKLNNIAGEWINLLIINEKSRNIIFAGIISILFISLILFSTLSRAEEPEELELADVIERAFTESHALKMERIRLDNSRISHKRTMADADTKSAKIRAERSINRAENQFAEKENEVIIDTVERYFDFIIDEMRKEVEKLDFELEEMDFSQTQTRYDLGQVGELNFRRQQINFDLDEFNFKRSMENYEENVQEFLIDFAYEENIELITFPPEIPDLPDENEFKEKMMDNSFQLYSLDIDIKLAEMDLDREKALDSPELDIKEAENDLKLLELEKEEAVKNLESSARGQYLSIEQDKKNVEVNRERLEQAEKSYEIAQEQKEMGIIKRSDLLEERKQLRNAEISYYQSRLDYYISYLELKESMGYELEGLIDGLEN